MRGDPQLRRVADNDGAMERALNSTDRRWVGAARMFGDCSVASPASVDKTAASKWLSAQPTKNIHDCLFWDLCLGISFTKNKAAR